MLVAEAAVKDDSLEAHAAAAVSAAPCRENLQTQNSVHLTSNKLTLETRDINHTVF